LFGSEAGLCPQCSTIFLYSVKFWFDPLAQMRKLRLILMRTQWTCLKASVKLQQLQILPFRHKLLRSFCNCRDRVLVKDQSTGQIMVLCLCLGSWTRATDANTSAEVCWIYTFVPRGRKWRCGFYNNK